MAYIIIKTDEQKEREKQMLKDFGYDPKYSNNEKKELAEIIARRTDEALRMGGIR